MDSPAFIFCNWKSRFWPAKVLTTFKQPLSKNSKLQVEIFEELKQTSVKYSDTKPFLLIELQKISEDLDRSENLKVTAEELRYRNALSTAMKILKEASAGESVLLKNDINAATIETCREAVKDEGANECTSSRKILTEKEAPGSTMVDGKTLKRGPCLKTKRSMRPRTSNKPNVHIPAQTDIDVKRKKVEDPSTEKGSCRGGKKTAPKMVSVSSTTKEQKSEKGKNRKATLPKEQKSEKSKNRKATLPKEQKSEKSKNRKATLPKEQKLGKSKNRKATLNHLSSAKEIQPVTSPDPDDDTTRNGNWRTKCLASKPTKMYNIQVPTTIQEFRSDTEVEDSHRKSKYNQLPLPDFSFTETDLSSELSMECSSPEFKAVPEVWPNDDTEEDVELPVIELKKEPVSFERGSFVWCKFKRYPYWPSLVKLVRHKEKRASIIFVEECLSDPNSQKQSFQVSLRTLKHYDCPEKKELLDVARKDYGKSVDWCDALICDYRIRLGCGSFSNSFLEYCTSAISYPVRKECCKTKLNFPSICQEIRDPVPNITDNDSHVKKKILPDRARASRDRANEKLVECIVKSRQAEPHLKGILTGKKKSHWLEKFQSSNQSVECQETYIEDEEQAELVMGYLQILCETMSIQSKKLMNGDQTKFILEVLFPEAVIFAISATEGLSFEKAEKKFLAGPLLSKRERKLFEKQIMDQKRIKLEENL